MLIRLALCVALLLSVVLLAGELTSRAQTSQPTTPTTFQRGVDLYRRGDAKAAVKVLRSAVKEQKENPEAWFYLGLAQNKSGDKKEARKAYEAALKLKPDYEAARVGLAWVRMLLNDLDGAEAEVNMALAMNVNNAESHFVLGTIYNRRGDPVRALAEADMSIGINARYASAHFLKAQAALGVYLKEARSAGIDRNAVRRENFRVAADSLEKYTKLLKEPEEIDLWREQLATLRVYAGDSWSGFHAAKDLDSKAVITKKPEPSYTEKARRAGVIGTVVLVAVLASDGTVKHVLAVQTLPGGLTERSIAAARKIEFEPATKNGRPVSQVVRIEYNFSMY